jgi:glyoxylase-like metal-dependent hydrolase (beta-lactamase superfamily II)
MPTQDLIYLDTTLKMPGMALPVRSAVIQLRNARVLFGPGSKQTAEQYQAAGAITDIVAPSVLHTAGMAKAAAQYPNARLWGPAGATKKLPQLKWHGTFESWPYADELAIIPLAGMAKAQEYLALHRASRTLFATDLVFNLDQASGFAAKIILSMFGTYRRFAVSRLFMMYVTDKNAFKKSVEKIPALDFDRVVPSHGAIVETDGKARMIAALKERKLIT